ncbi:Trypsin Inhibitor-like, cysteine rich domain-containing protein [Strongyloides ratti]|uniref:Trypsin Inhibitor-like, cysteine rich domain-containing protein n=1 Tax=Strongyloides ratti TaxID=34506 RepID=A0A090MWV6_STRRB|nr:Trypsin Inhibitor-like, cysteine rich domain-containing protein [Strongyloides ratti]CEF64349.1 Trypsin Inhibitor-like, cysteine rich domain-containing protein [Strongyloides ratti]
MNCVSPCPPRCSESIGTTCFTKCTHGGCECRHPFALDDNNNCILRRDCPTKTITTIIPRPTPTKKPTCSGNLVYSKCRQRCETKCSDKSQRKCGVNCKSPGCECKYPFVRDSKNNCIHKSKCPSKPKPKPTTTTSTTTTTVTTTTTTTEMTTPKPTTKPTKKPTTKRTTTKKPTTKKPTTKKPTTTKKTTTKKPTTTTKTTTKKPSGKQCPTNMEYSECPSKCVRKCLCEEDRCNCKKSGCGKAGCICKKGYILYLGKCITEEKCKTLEENFDIYSNDLFY